MTSQNDFPARTLLLCGLAWLLLLAGLRVYLAAELQLFGDEAFYRWESQNPAWAYSDLPPATALLIRAGNALWGESELALRGFFLLSGLALPAAVYFLAWPLSGRRGGLLAAGLSLLLPATATVGVLAVPDSLLLTQCTLLLGCIERACRSDGLRWWFGAGLLACLGFLIHYRFVFVPLSLGLAFLCYPALRVLLARPGPWILVALALLGLVPAAIFNLGNDFAAMGFHFSERHPWTFHTEGLAYALQQAAAVSPLLYLFVLLALWHSLRRALAGDRNHALLSSVSLFYIAGLILLAPWLDQTSTTIHWAWFGYVPMLAVLPELLQRWWRVPAGRLLSVAGLGLAALFALGSLGMMLASLHYPSLPEKLRPAVSVKMVGWDELRERVEHWYHPGETLYSSEYYVAAQLREAPFLQSRMVVLEQEKIHRDGRARQLYLWRALEQFAPTDGSDGLIVMDFETGNRNEVYRQVDQLCRRFARIRTLEEFSRFDGRRRYGLYRGEGARAPQDYAQQPDLSPLCLPPLRGRVDSKHHYRKPVSGQVPARGYLLAQPDGIERVFVRVGQSEFELSYGTPRPDVLDLLGELVFDPNWPKVGFRGSIDSTVLPNGEHAVAFVGITASGREEVFHTDTLRVAN